MYLNSQNKSVILYFVYIIIVFLCLFHFFPPIVLFNPNGCFHVGSFPSVLTNYFQILLVQAVW